MSYIRGYILSNCLTSGVIFSLIVLHVQAASNMKSLDVGANVFIGNLDPEIDEKLLYDIFSAFGVILQTPKVDLLIATCNLFIIGTLPWLPWCTVCF